MLITDKSGSRLACTSVAQICAVPEVSPRSSCTGLPIEELRETACGGKKVSLVPALHGHVRAAPKIAQRYGKPVCVDSAGSRAEESLCGLSGRSLSNLKFLAWYEGNLKTDPAATLISFARSIDTMRVRRVGLVQRNLQLQPHHCLAASKPEFMLAIVCVCKAAVTPQISSARRLAAFFR